RGRDWFQHMCRTTKVAQRNKSHSDPLMVFVQNMPRFAQASFELTAPRASRHASAVAAYF
ncbi:MAG TPA: hypothetical protein VF278_08785, partial [Pirellulales bacterium]